jgi:hypothetical protein
MAFIDFGNSELNRKALAAGKSLADVYAIRGTEISDTSKTQYQIDQSSKPDQGFYKSQLNTPVLHDLKFVGIKNYTDEQGNTYNFDDVVLQAVLVTISQSKNIVKTAIQGRKGTIKEYVGMDDYVLNINGVIHGPNGSYPKDEIANLKNMLTCQHSIEVVSWYLHLWDIYHIVIEDFSINPEEGGYSYQPFTITAISDKPQYLSYIKP